MADLDDDTLLTRFETCEMPKGTLTHEMHVRLAWLYLGRHEPLEALRRLVEGIQHLAAAHGVPGIYHQTTTWAYAFLIEERRRTMARGHTWSEFKQAHPDLLDHASSVLARYYEKETLASERARRGFVMPDRIDAR